MSFSFVEEPILFPSKLEISKFCPKFMLIATENSAHLFYSPKVGKASIYSDQAENSLKFLSVCLSKVAL